jgi:hypothetical protein
MKKPGEFIMKRYPISESVLRAAPNGHATIKFVATRALAGGICDSVYA